ncbi:MAG: hypothetical protein ACUVX1_15085 [Chloroflexota bacterium]
MTPRNEDENRPVEVAEAPNAVIASAWRELLQQEGIAATIKCDDPLAVAYLITSPNPCKILVPASQAQRTKEILESLTAEEMPDEPDTDGDS